jgi:hypothetical protein
LAARMSEGTMSLDALWFETAATDCVIDPRACGGRRGAPKNVTQTQLLQNGTLLGDTKEIPMDPQEFNRGGIAWGRQSHWPIGVQIGGNWHNRDMSRGPDARARNARFDKARTTMKKIGTWPWWLPRLDDDWKNWVGPAQGTDPHGSGGNGYSGVLWRLQRQKWVDAEALAPAGEGQSVVEYDKLYVDIHGQEEFDQTIAWTQPFLDEAKAMGITIQDIWADWCYEKTEWDGTYAKYPGGQTNDEKTHQTLTKH